MRDLPATVTETRRVTETVGAPAPPSPSAHAWVDATHRRHGVLATNGRRTAKYPRANRRDQRRDEHGYDLPLIADAAPKPTFGGRRLDTPAITTPYSD